LQCVAIAVALAVEAPNSVRYYYDDDDDDNDDDNDDDDDDDDDDARRDVDVKC
jgi:hypothetical protein